MTHHPTPVFEVSGLTKSYNSVIAVDDLSMHVNRGEICGLIGPNGSGKSTFFDCCTGLARRNAGQVLIDGQDVSDWSLNRIAREGRLLRSFQKTVVYKSINAEENLIIAGQMFAFPSLVSTYSFGRRARQRVETLRKRARELVEIVGLAAVAHQPAGNLSGGQQKLIQFASMLMPQPKIILLDEPMAGINPEMIKKVMENIVYANRDLGISFLIIEHNIDVITSLCSRVAVLDQGAKLAEGTPAEIIADKRVREAYLGG
ncbi:MAG: ABC transporter ATP-binding protein [Geminicoccaceae bacterium]|nr:ABC transporter ATP-binding protein [Geminicoccaceae bacterium]